VLELTGEISAPFLQSAADGLEVISKKSGIQHWADCTCDTMARMEPTIRKAVFPAAGLGTRFLPATKVLPKEMLVLVDKPVIQYGVEEAVRSGVPEIIVVTSRGKGLMEDHFDVAFELETVLDRRRKTAQLAEIRQMAGVGHISYVRQHEPLGLGHAVLVARNLVGDEPFAVILSDEVIDATPPALKQMIDVFGRVRGPVIAVEEVSPEDVSSYGIVAVDERGDLGRGIYRITDLVEKPPRQEAPSNLAIIGRYVLTPDIFPALEATAGDRNDEIQLTNGLRRLMRDRPLYACTVDGVRHDTGNKLGFLKAVLYFALQRPDLAGSLRRYLETLAGNAGARSSGLR
jgi:UTP--glucose-1-phosphate uridylyltransferase